MGLDMYLNGTRYLWYKEDALKAQIAAAIPDAPGEIKRVVVEAAYWRKANAIHAWFVKHVQNGTDDCGDYDVSLKTLMVLRDTCRQVLADPSKAPELLPAQAGFFFGRTDYDDSYLDDLKQTDEMLTKLIDGAERFAQWTYAYHSSW